MRSLKLMIEDAGFPPGYADSFAKKFEHKLNRLDEADRLIVEALIPEILAVGEDCWMIPVNGPSDKGSLDALIKAVLDPSYRPQEAVNRE